MHWHRVLPEAQKMQLRCIEFILIFLTFVAIAFTKFSLETNHKMDIGTCNKPYELKMTFPLSF